MPRSLENKTAVVTAAARGIGKASALALARDGATVIATDVDVAELESLRGTKGITTRELDVTDRKEIERFSSWAPSVDILFNCAGYVHHGTILECDEDAFERTHQLNVVSMFRMIKVLLPSMLARRSGSIINMASAASSIIGAQSRFAYGTSKAAVIGLTKSLSADFVEHGIRANAICPGTVDTPSLRQRIATSADPANAMVRFLARQPSGRFGTQEEIAELVVFLASDVSSFISGATLVVDGGWSSV